MTTTPATTTLGSETIAAIEIFWTSLCDAHAELPRNVVFITGMGADKHGLTRGHAAAGRWTTDNGKAHEIFVSGERIADGGFGVATTIIHEAAHLLLLERGDMTMGTSRQYRYHTKSGFAAAAIELGLIAPAKAHPVLGFSDCTMSDETALKYAAEITILNASLSARIVTVTMAELAALVIALGAIAGGIIGAGIVPWWINGDAAGLWGSLGGSIKAPRKPRTAKVMVELTCGCRSLKVEPAVAEVLADLKCTRCDCSIVAMATV